MEQKAARKEILDWLRAGQPYEEGIQLFAKYSNNATVLKNFSRKMNQERKDKLAYKLVVKIANLPEKYIALDPKKLPQGKKKDPKKPVDPKKGQNIKPNTETKGKTPPPNTTAPQTDLKPAYEKAWEGKIPYKDLPKEIRDLINQRVDAEQDIKALSENRLAVPAKNNEKNNKARKDLSEQIDVLLGKKNELNAQIKQYEETLELPKTDEETGPDPKPKTEAEIVLELTKKYNNLKSQRSKCRNQVFGNEKTKKDPLPAGPKLEAAKIKLAGIEQEIKEVEEKLKPSK
jgi:hypothetical protein